LALTKLNLNITSVAPSLNHRLYFIPHLTIDIECFSFGNTQYRSVFVIYWMPKKIK